jgi:hypothetical protein
VRLFVGGSGEEPDLAMDKVAGAESAGFQGDFGCKGTLLVLTFSRCRSVCFADCYRCCRTTGVQRLEGRRSGLEGADSWITSIVSFQVSAPRPLRASAD